MKWGKLTIRKHKTMTEDELKNLFRRPSTIDEKAEAIISYLSSKGLTPGQILEVIKLTKIKLKNHDD